MNGFSLNNLSLFDNLTNKEIKIVSDFLIEKNYTNEEKIFIKGKTRTKLVIIKDGLVKLNTDIADHQETIAMFRAGDFLGEMAFLQKNSLHQHTLIVASPNLTTLELSIYHWFTIQKKYPEISQKIYHNIAINLKSRLDHSNNKLVTLFAGGKIIALYDNMNEISKHLTEIILKVIPVKKALFCTVSNINNKATVQYALGYKINIGANFDLLNDTFLAKIIENKKTKIFNKSDWSKEHLKLPYISNSLLITPINLGKKTLGLIILADKLSGRDFSANNQILLDALATQIAPAIEEHRLSALQNSSEDLKKVYIDPFYNI